MLSRHYKIARTIRFHDFAKAIIFSFLAFACSPLSANQAAELLTLPDPAAAIRTLDKSQKESLDEIVLKSYREKVLPYSLDQILTNDQTRSAFVKKCQTLQRNKNLSELKPFHFCWRLLSLRKAGKLTKSTERVKKLKGNSADRILAEIAARSCEDQFGVNLDRILIHQKGRQKFAMILRSIKSKKINSSDLQTAYRTALNLRKARKLRPELTRQLIQWKPEIRTISAKMVLGSAEQIPKRPGIYIFHDRSGYLYIGEAKDLRTRLENHLAGSDRKSLAKYFQKKDLSEISIDLHVFPAGSPGEKVSVRRAYESELIRSRKPKFNIRP